MMADPFFITIIVISFALAGLVKGTVGLGLPTVSLGLLSLFADLPTALALLVMPSLITNIWQAIAGGHFKKLVLRLWPLLVMTMIMVHVGSLLFTRINAQVLTATLGMLLLLYAMVGLIGKVPSISPAYEKILAPVCGAVNGLLTGLTGTLFVPGVMFLQAIGLPRDALIQAMGMLFAASTASLGIALYQNDLMPLNLWLLSIMALVPALIGMNIGRIIRRFVPEDLFRKVFLVALGCLGCYISFGAVNQPV
tara:strand:+ start:222 stop:977 length:756 start_codon:yes stop_codon:yes gene_type:complete